MSKSTGNTILLADSADEIKRKMRSAVTDPLKVKKHDPGRPEICLVFTYHKKFNDEETEGIARDCRSGALGCVDCKLRASVRIDERLEPIRERRRYYEEHLQEVYDVLEDGETRARARAQATMSQVHEVMSLG